MIILRSLLYLFIFFTVSWANANTPNDLTAHREAKQQLHTLQNEISDLKSTLAADNSQQQQLSTELRETALQISELSRALHELDDKIEHASTQKAQQQRQLNQLEQQLQRHNEKIAHLIRYYYRTTKQHGVKLLLSLENPTDLNRTLRYASSLNSAYKIALDDVLAHIQQINQLQAALTEHIIVIKQQQAERNRTLHTQEQIRRQRQTLLDTVRDNIQTKRQQLIQLEAQETALSVLIEKIMSRLSDVDDTPHGPTFKSSQGHMPWPVAGAIHTYFGQKYFNNQLTYHGIFIAAAEGQQVVAVNAGRIVYADWLKGYGLLLIVEHDEGYMTLYGNNLSLYKDTGDWVTSGEIIAQTGKNDFSDEAGLYFEIRHNGVPSDPLDWLHAAS